MWLAFSILPRIHVSLFLVLQISHFLLVVVALETCDLTLSNQAVNLLATGFAVGYSKGLSKNLS